MNTTITLKILFVISITINMGLIFLLNELIKDFHILEQKVKLLQAEVVKLAKENSEELAKASDFHFDSIVTLAVTPLTIF